jgi:hypothetical protein
MCRVTDGPEAFPKQVNTCRTRKTGYEWFYLIHVSPLRNDFFFWVAGKRCERFPRKLASDEIKARIACRRLVRQI